MDIAKVFWTGRSQAVRLQKQFRFDDNVDDVDLRSFTMLDFNRTDARHAGQVRAALRARGTPIGPYDILIAGQALACGLVLVTHNVADFSCVEGLSIEDWER